MHYVQGLHPWCANSVSILIYIHLLINLIFPSLNSFTNSVLKKIGHYLSLTLNYFSPSWKTVRQKNSERFSGGLEIPSNQEASGCREPTVHLYCEITQYNNLFIFWCNIYQWIYFLWTSRLICVKYVSILLFYLFPV